MTSNPNRPLPRPGEWDEGFWAAAADGQLVVQACASCDAVRNFPRMMCPKCGSMEIRWIEASGTGTIYTWTVLRREFHPEFSELPMLVAVIALDDHPDVHLFCNLDTSPYGDIGPDDPQFDEAVYIGAPVEVTFETYNGFTMPQFRLKAAAHS